MDIYLISKFCVFFCCEKHILIVIFLKSAALLNIMYQNKEKLFWKLHLSWWGIATIYATFPTYKLPELSSINLVVFYFFHYSAMVGLTYLYRLIYNQINPFEQNRFYLIISPLIGVIITGVIFFVINSHDFIYHYKYWEGKIYTIEMRFAYLIDCIWDTLPWFLGYHLFRYARVSTEREVELENSLQESELDRLRKQLNPHFLFNALNGIKALVLTEPQQSREAIGQLSDLLRLSLKTNLNENIYLSEEVEILENYLAIEKIRFHERLMIEIDIPLALRNQKVLPFCLQILAENAVKHGIGKLKKGGIIKVLAEKKNADLILKVINTGSLINDADYLEDKTSIGLENLKKRLKINFGEKAMFNIEGQNGLVTATIVLPLEA
jgi:two-component system, LytTR family, sensor kinase